MYKLKKIKQLALLMGMFLIAYGCKKPNNDWVEEYYKTTYYDVVGEGYVFRYDALGNALYPIQGAEVEVYTGLEGAQPSFLFKEPSEFFLSDSTGKYQVRFIKRAKGYDAEDYCIYLRNALILPFHYYSVDKVKNAKSTIILDTLKKDR